VDVHEIQVRHAGEHIYISCHCTLPDDLIMQRVHVVITALEDRLKKECPEVDRVMIHPEPVADNLR
jgi:divalent metal cation (Fe/Co/Zn/Cd) transporter